VQLRVDLDLPAGMADDDRAAAAIRRLADDAVLHRIGTGRDAPHTRSHVLRWQNPGRKRGEDRQWRQGNQPDAWTTLGPAIAAAIEMSR
jgi:hypothetical protein